MKILVTGGLGYIGSHTVVELVQNGYKPIIVDNFSNSYPEVIVWLTDILGFKPITYNVDCTDYRAFKDVFKEHKDIQGVIHFAAFKAVGHSVEEPLIYYKNNIDSLLVLMELMEEYNVKNLVFSSSCTVYGTPADSIQVTENTPLQPATSPYGHTKIVAEEIIRNVCHTKAIKAVLLRYFNPIGAHSSAKIGELPIGRPSNLVPFITQTAIGIREHLTVNGNTYNTPDGTNIRDYIHVSDLADAHIKSLDYLKNQEENISVFNVGTGNGNSVLEVVNTFEKVTGQKLNYKIGPKRAGDVEAIYANAEKIQKVLHWKPRFSLEESLLSSWKWQENLQNIGFKIEKENKNF